MQKEEIRLLIKNHSKQRICSYNSILKDEYKNKLEYMCKAYMFNQDMCMAFYPLLSNIEITLRNAIIEFLEQEAVKTKANKTWYGFLVDKLTNKKRKNKDTTYVINEIKEQRRKYTCPLELNNKLVSNMNFGFWTAIVNTYDNNLIYSIFKCKRKQELKSIKNNLKTIRSFRNNCFHYENILKNRSKNTNKSQKRQLMQTYEDIFSILGKIGGLKYAEFIKNKHRNSTKIDYNYIKNNLRYLK